MAQQPGQHQPAHHEPEHRTPVLERRSTRWLMIAGLLAALIVMFIAFVIGGGSNVPD